jgi:dihydrolipoamide dehydrogenase
VSDVEVSCPDLGDFKDVAIIEVLVKPGDHIDVDTPLITLETDKATMDVPSTVAGEVTALLVQPGGRVSKGTPIARVHTAQPRGESATTPTATAASGQGAAQAAAAPASSPPAAGPAAPAASPAAAPPPALAPAPAAARAPAGGDGGAAAGERAGVLSAEPEAKRRTQLLVLGSGPGGYTAAFRAADLGLAVTLVERYERLGGVCLNVGCIPSKALLHAAKVIDDAQAMSAHGITFGAPQLDFAKLRAWKNSVVSRLTGGLAMLAKQRKVEVVRGTGRFVSPHVIEVTRDGAESETIGFDQCIIAAGSQAATLPFVPKDPRVIDSTGALELPANPGRMLVIGGGIIGLEMACVYEALGARIDVVELTGQLIPGCDVDLVRPLEKRIRARYGQILLNTRVTALEARPDALHVTFEAQDGKRSTHPYDHVLVAIGRRPNGKRIGAERAGVRVDERGFIAVDRQLRTNVAHIFAIGDVVGQPMLAHKASHEGKVAAEVAAGHKSYFDARVIPAVAYTDPEIAWVGLSENAAREQRIEFERAAFPWAASGRSLSLGRDEGLTKLLFDPQSHRVLGGGIVGTNAGELIAEIALAVEMGADAADIGLTIHAHPTLSETVMFAAEACEGSLTDLYMPKKR